MTVGERGSSPSIEIVCTDHIEQDPNGSARREVVARFTRHGEGDWASWWQDDRWSRRTQNETRDVKWHPRHLVGTNEDGSARLDPPLRGSTHLAEEMVGFDDDGNAVTRRFRFQCHLCRTTVPGRIDKLAAIFDTLAEHGVSCIELELLRGRLSKRSC